MRSTFRHVSRGLVATLVPFFMMDAPVEAQSQHGTHCFQNSASECVNAFKIKPHADRASDGPQKFASAGHTRTVHFTNDATPGQWLDVFNGGDWDKVARMSDSAGYSGQLWSMKAGRGGLRFTNLFTGDNQCLTVVETHLSGEGHVPMMAPCGSAPHQDWLFKNVGGGHGFVMRDFGADECLTAVGPGEHLIMAPCGSSKGQSWHILDTDTQ